MRKVECGGVLVGPGREGTEGLFKTANAPVVVGPFCLKLGCKGDPFVSPLGCGCSGFGLSISGDGGELDTGVGDSLDDVFRKVDEDREIDRFEGRHADSERRR